MTPTPETDAFAIKFKTPCGEKYWVPVDLSRKLERERDEAREAMREAWLAMDETEGTDRMIKWQNKYANILEETK